VRIMNWKQGPRRQDAHQTSRARTLRRTMTPDEEILWSRLRNGGLNGLKFRRQVPFGPYFLDFYCAEARLAIEVDGGQHFQEDVIEYDRVRSDYLRRHGLRVVRYSNKDVLASMGVVLEEILRESSPGPSGHPLLFKEREIPRGSSLSLFEKERVGARIQPKI
jgi:very-short-patch-repair endonuclease